MLKPSPDLMRARVFKVEQTLRDTKIFTFVLRFSKEVKSRMHHASSLAFAMETPAQLSEGSRSHGCHEICFRQHCSTMQ